MPDKAGAKGEARKQGAQRASRPARARRRTQLAAPAAVPTAMRASSIPGGQVLPDDLRGRMEAAFGASFADVRVHADDAAALNAGDRHARAYATGRHIVFGRGQYAPASTQGRELIAHELAHVVQQSRATGMDPGATGALEHDAHRAAGAAVTGQAADVGLAAAPGVAQCAPEVDETDIRRIPDPGAGKIRVVRVDKQGRIVQGLAEITPNPGEVQQAHRVSVTKKPDGRYEIGVPEEWQGTKNPAAKVDLEKETEMDFLDEDLIVSDNPEDKHNTDEEVQRFLSEQHPEIAHLYQFPLGRSSELEYWRKGDEFKAWRKNQVVKAEHKAFKDQVERENEWYRRQIDPTGEFGYTGEQARKIVEDAHGPVDATPWEKQRQAKNTSLTAIRDAETGVIVGYVTYEYREVRLAGGVGEVATVILDRNGKEVQRDAETVLTPATEFWQDVARGAPISGQLINAAEVGGLSLNVKDPGRFLSEGERTDRFINAVPFADTVRSGMEVTTGVDLSDRGIDAQLNGDVLILPDRIRKGKAILLGVEALGALIGARVKVKPKVKARAPKPPKLPAAAAKPKPRPKVHAPPPKARARPKSPTPARTADASPVSPRRPKAPKRASSLPANDNAKPPRAKRGPPEAANDNGSAKPANDNASPPRAKRRPPAPANDNDSPKQQPRSQAIPEEQEFKATGTGDAQPHQPKRQGGGDVDAPRASNKPPGSDGPHAKGSPAKGGGAHPPSGTSGAAGRTGTRALPDKPPASLPDVKAKSQRAIKALEDEISDLDSEIGKLDARIADAQVTLDDVRSELRRLDTQAKHAKKGGAAPTPSTKAEKLLRKLLTPAEQKQLAKLRASGKFKDWEVQRNALKGLEPELDRAVRLDGGLLEQRAGLAGKKRKAIEHRNDLQGVLNMPDRGGGSHSKIRDKTNGGEVNHIPPRDACDALDLSYDEAPAIWMSVEDHKKTKSWGGLSGSKEHRMRQRQLIAEGRFHDAVRMDLDDIKAKFPDGRYDAFIEQMRHYINNSLSPDKLKPRKR